MPQIFDVIVDKIGDTNLMNKNEDIHHSILRTE